MALVTAHLNAGVILVVTVLQQVYNLPIPPHLTTPFPPLPVPNKPYGFCGRKATLNETVHRAQECVKVEVATMGSSSLTCLLYTSPSPRDVHKSRMPSSA